ncbi:carbohydrate sulfotransferase 12-like [Homarus americanus]|uniref:carbohydrate sulfotransferase 12-like n=1 Tax=Homarus americanus TaxID=6706 RepID=UPI001C45E99E|nr:carbohydrate sulfotransferase 12-like [Homarus americanus]
MQDHAKGDEDPWEAEQRERRTAMREGCGNVPYDTALNAFFNSKRRSKFNHLLVDDIHRAMYCYIPKVSSTTLKRLWMKMTSFINVDWEKKKISPHVFFQSDGHLGKYQACTKPKLHLHSITQSLNID